MSNSLNLNGLLLVRVLAKLEEVEIGIHQLMSLRNLGKIFSLIVLDLRAKIYEVIEALEMLTGSELVLLNTISIAVDSLKLSKILVILARACIKKGNYTKALSYLSCLLTLLHELGNKGNAN